MTRTILLIGCLVLSVPRWVRADELPTGLSRTTVVKTADGNTTEKSRPITSKEKSKECDSDQTSFLGSLIGGLLSGGVQSSESVSVSGVETSSESSSPTVWGGQLELGYNRTRIWNTLTTDFHSGAFSHVRWQSTPEIRGDGAEASLLFNADTPVSLGVSVGGFQGSHVANAQSEGPLYARETIQTKGYFFDGELRGNVVPWFYLDGALGAFIYDLSTAVDSNAPDFVYHGISGTRVVGALGIGAGLQTPWKFPVKAFIETRFWLPLNGDQPVESAIGQLRAGLSYHF
jgi:hypothetical protein